MAVMRETELALLCRGWTAASEIIPRSSRRAIRPRPSPNRVLLPLQRQRLYLDAILGTISLLPHLLFPEEELEAIFTYGSGFP